MNAGMWSRWRPQVLQIGKIYDALVERKTLDRASLGPDILHEMAACARRSKEDYGQLLAWFRQWHASMPTLF